MLCIYVLFMILMQLFDVFYLVMTGPDIPSRVDLPNKCAPYRVIFYYYYSACSPSSQRVMQVIAFPPHLCLCLAVQIKVLPKLFFRESDHQVGWCPSGRFNLMSTRLSHLASIVHPLFKLHDQPIFFSLLPDHIFHPWHIPQMFFFFFFNIVSLRDFEYDSLNYFFSVTASFCSSGLGGDHISLPYSSAGSTVVLKRRDRRVGLLIMKKLHHDELLLMCSIVIS